MILASWIHSPLKTDALHEAGPCGNPLPTQRAGPLFCLRGVHLGTVMAGSRPRLRRKPSSPLQGGLKVWVWLRGGWSSANYGPRARARVRLSFGPIAGGSFSISGHDPMSERQGLTRRVRELEAELIELKRRLAWLSDRTQCECPRCATSPMVDVLVIAANGNS
jgi:hypothetical protein